MVSTAVKNTRSRFAARDISRSALLLAAIISFALGTISMVTGLMICVLSYFEKMHFGADLGLLILSVVLWGIGACLMDIIEETERRNRK